jgi:hypothetical protein
VFWTVDLETKRRSRLTLGYRRPQWAADGKSVVGNVYLFTGGDEERYEPHAARIWLDKPYKPEPLFPDLDTPRSPSFSKDGKTLVLVVDSDKPARLSDKARGGKE